MNWIKKGLVYVPENVSIKDTFTHAAIPFADLISEDNLRIYFSSRNHKGQSLPFFIEVDPASPASIINTCETPLLDLGPIGTFDDNGIMPSCIVNISDNIKYLYYIGWNPQVTVSYRLAIGLAISDNKGKTFKKYSLGPICDRSLSEPFFNTAPYVIYDNGIFKMWYISCTGWTIINNYPEPSYHVKYAESDNGIIWSKNNVVCIDYDTSAEAIGRPSVLKEEGIYKMWYSYRKLGGYRIDRNNSYTIGYAESYDGINWSKKDSEVGISKSEGGWDSEMIEYCHIIRYRNMKYMFYNGNGFGKSGFGYALIED
jgi:hypothetical protein